MLFDEGGMHICNHNQRSQKLYYMLIKITKNNKYINVLSFDHNHDNHNKLC